MQIVDLNNLITHSQVCICRFDKTRTYTYDNLGRITTNYRNSIKQGDVCLVLRVRNHHSLNKIATILIHGKICDINVNSIILMDEFYV